MQADDINDDIEWFYPTKIGHVKLRQFYWFRFFPYWRGNDLFLAIEKCYCKQALYNCSRKSVVGEIGDG